jgi:hypothetical protein
MKNSKNIIFVSTFLVIIYLLQGCLSKPYCIDIDTTQIGIVFRSTTTGSRIPSVYKKVYEKSVRTNIDSLSLASQTIYNHTSDTLNYLLPLPRTNPVPEELCFIFEKANGQKDSITIRGHLKIGQFSSCSKSIIPYYESINIIPSKTSFNMIQKNSALNQFARDIFYVKL